MVQPDVGAPLDRRARRRLESKEEVLDIAMEVMAEAGVSGLSLGEVARRMGLRPPSLYQYFASKNAIYDELFARGWRDLDEHMATYDPARGRPTSARKARALLVEATSAFVRWAVEHPVHAQLMFWRPVPGFEPSRASFVPALESIARFRAALATMVDAGWLRPEAADEEAVRAHTALVSGVISQHLANEPQVSFEQGRFTTLLPLLTDMFFDYYVPRKGHR